MKYYIIRENEEIKVVTTIDENSDVLGKSSDKEFIDHYAKMWKSNQSFKDKKNKMVNHLDLSLEAITQELRESQEKTDAKIKQGQESLKKFYEEKRRKKAEKYGAVGF